MLVQAKGLCKIEITAWATGMGLRGGAASKELPPLCSPGLLNQAQSQL